MSSDAALNRADRFFNVVVVGNVLAAPLYWQELMPVVQMIVGSPNGTLTIAAVAAFMVAVMIAGLWRRSVRIGAVVQLGAVLMPVTRMVLTYEGGRIVPSGHDLADARFGIALLLLCVVPAVLIATSALALRRQLKKPNGTQGRSSICSPSPFTLPS